MSAKERKEGPPISMPDADPSGNYSFLEIIMSMQNAMGRLTEAVDTLKTESRHQRDKLEQIGKDVHAAKVVVGLAGALILLAAGAIGWVIYELLPYFASHPASPVK